MRQDAVCTFGKAITSRMLEALVMSIASLSRPYARRSAVLEGAHQEAEALPGLFLGKAQLLKHLLLYLGGVDTYGAAANLVAVEHDIVCFGANLALIGIQQVQIFIHR